MPRITFVLATLLSLMAFTPVAAQDYQRGMDAYNAGDYATALKEFRPLAEQGNADAQYHFGQMYEGGLGVNRDLSEAAKWHRVAAEQGHVKAQYTLGIMYFLGQGTLLDNSLAYMWWNLAAANGHKKAGGWRDELAKTMTPTA